MGKVWRSPESEAKRSKAREEWRKTHRDRVYAHQRAYYRRTAASGTHYARQLRRKFGLTLEQYTAQETAQGGVCAICKLRPQPRLAVDHDHSSGKLRGLLCRACNTTLGLLAEDAERFRRAVEYLERGGVWL